MTIETVSGTVATFEGPAIGVSASPDKDGYHVHLGGFPFHVHPNATPGEFQTLKEMMEAGDIEVLAYVPPPQPSPESVKAGKWEAIKVERDRRTDQGGYKVGTKWFHSDQKSRGQQLGLVLLGASIPANLQWKTMDGSFVTMTQQLAGQVLAAAAASDQAIFAAAEAHRQAMEASADPADYDFSTGWPKVFGE